jgi:flagellum-specific peptidoglycan hydrolase FlgJ
MTRQEYIEKYKTIVIESVKGTGLFASLMMAQAILESSDKNGIPGNSTLAKLYNNHFGIKADKSWQGKKINLKTREVLDGNEVMIGDYFRVYDNPEQSFKDRIQFLKRNTRYSKAGVFVALSPKEQAQALKAAGYATDPNYPAILTALITRHNLSELDKLS